MICAVSDTHRETGHGLSGRTLEAVREADLVVHAGDVTGVDALESIRAECADLRAVSGNSDAPGVSARLEPVRVLEADGLRIVATHGDRHSETSLSLLGRQEDADLVIAGHTHRPAVVEADDVVLVNPGSPTEPRGSRPSHAELVPEADEGRLVTAGGETIAEFDLRSSAAGCRRG